MALLTTTLDVSGAERVLAAVATGLAAAGYRVTVIGLQRRSGALARLVANPRIDVIDFGFLRSTHVAAVWRLRNWLIAQRVSVLYTFLFHAHLVGRLAGRLAGVPCLLASQQVAGWGARWQRRVDAVTGRWCRFIVAVSESVREDLIHRMGVSPERIRLIPNAIDTTTFVSARDPFNGPAGLTVGAASRFAPEKDHDSLLRGIALLKNSGVDVKTRLAGTGEREASLRALANDLGLGDRIEWLGRIDDVRAFHDTLDVYVQPSWTEGLPCAVLEAMAMGRPVIATDVPGNRDAVAHGRTGLLIPPGSPTAWADALAIVRASPVQAREWGSAGRLRACREFDVERMVENTLALLAECGFPIAGP